MANACFERFSQARLTEKPEPDTTKVLAGPALNEVAQNRVPSKFIDGLLKKGVIYHRYGKPSNRLLSDRHKPDRQAVRALWKDMPDVGAPTD